MKILQRYILREHLVPFLLSLLVVTFVLLIDRVIDLLNLILEKKLDLVVVIQLFALSLPYMLALSIPMAVLVATILAFGRMTVDRETIAMKSSGISIYQKLLPLFITGVLLTGVMIWFNHSYLPNTNHKLKNLMIKIAYYKPLTNIKPNEFTSLPEYTIFVKGNQNNILSDVLIYDRTQTKIPRTIFAKSGEVVQMDKGNSMQIILHNGEMHERNEREAGKYQLRKFEILVVNIRDLALNLDVVDSAYRSDRELTYSQLVSSIKDKQKELQLKQVETTNLQKRLALQNPQSDSYSRSVELRRLGTMLKLAEDQKAEIEYNLRSLKVEYHKKFAISFAIMIFILIGVPLGLMTRTSGIGMAFSVSALIFLIYYIALTGGEQLADKGNISPMLSMWITNIFFTLLGIILVYASIREKQLINLNLLRWRISHIKAKRETMPDEIIH